MKLVLGLGAEWVHAAVARRFEGGKVGMIAVEQALFLDQLPQPFDPIEIGAAGGKKQ